MICLPDNYQKYDLPHHQDAVREPVNQWLHSKLSLGIDYKFPNHPGKGRRVGGEGNLSCIMT